MIVIGIDPGIARVGYGVIRKENGLVSTIAYGCIQTDKDTPPTQRLYEIYTDLDQIITRFKPDSVAMEKLFFTKP